MSQIIYCKIWIWLYFLKKAIKIHKKESNVTTKAKIVSTLHFIFTLYKINMLIKYVIKKRKIAPIYKTIFDNV